MYNYKQFLYNYKKDINLYINAEITSLTVEFLQPEMLCDRRR